MRCKGYNPETDSFIIEIDRTTPVEIYAKAACYAMAAFLASFTVLVGMGW